MNSSRANDDKLPESVRRLRRFMWLPWIVVIGLVIALSVFSIWVSEGLKDRAACLEQLGEIYRGLEQYDQTYGQLPSLAFYPTNPKTDEKSICVALQPFGTYEELFVCPHSAPRIQKEQGLSYLWNVALNGKPLRNFGADTWMLIEIEAMSGDIVPPHFRRYNVLYANGEVRHVRSVPPGIRIESE